jgi:transposase
MSHARPVGDEPIHGAAREGAIALQVRPLTAEEATELQRRVASRTLPARVVERAKMVWAVHAGERVPAVARRLDVGADVVRGWVTRFNAAGLAGLADRPRAGRPAAYTAEEVGEVIAAALTKPQHLGLPFSAWTLDRLAAYLTEHKGIAIKRSRIGELLVDEGLRWRTQETWFGERAALEAGAAAESAAGTTAQDAAAPAADHAPRKKERPVDPAFAEKRGRSRSSTRRRRRAA